MEFAPAFEVPPETPVPVRVKMLEELVREGSRDPVVYNRASEILGPARRPVREALQYLLDAIWRPVADGGLGMVYTPEPPGVEVFQTARYSMTTQQADCEDLAVLFAAMARSQNYAARVNWIDQDNAPNNHVAAQACMTIDHRGSVVPSQASRFTTPGGRFAVKVHVPPTGPACPADAWEWVETTLPGAMVGEHPYAALARIGTGPVQRADIAAPLPAHGIRPAGISRYRPRSV